MKIKIQNLPWSSFSKIVFLYAIVSTVYLYLSDYFVEKFVTQVNLLANLEIYKELGFVHITTTLLYFLIKKNTTTTRLYYQQQLDEKQAADDQLKKSHDDYMTMFNLSPSPMWLYDLETLKFIIVNKSACLEYGYSNEEFLMLTIKDIRSPEDFPFLEQLFARFRNGENYSNENIARHKKKDGTIIQVKVNINLILFRGKKVLLASAVNISSEIEVQNQLIEINSRLQSASKIAKLGYWTNDLKNAKIQWSDELYKIFEFDPQTFDLNLNNIIDYYHPEDRLSFTANFEDFKNNTIQDIERRIITGTGTIKWILESIQLIKDEKGTPIKLDGIVIDITKIKLKEQEVKESNERFKIIAKATTEAIIDWDLKNDVVLWGEGFHTIFGYDLSFYDNYLWSNNIHLEDREKVIDDLNKALKDPTKEHFNTSFRFLKANKEITYVQFKGIFIREANGKATRALAAMIDLTETLSRIHKIEYQNNVLKEIAWTQSHEVRAPLANLQGFVKLLKENTKLLETDEDNLIDYIIASSEKLDEVIRNIVSKTRDIDAIQSNKYYCNDADWFSHFNYD